MKSIFTCIFLLFSGLMLGQSSAEILRWKQYSKRTTIYRDFFGVPHIYGKKDADAVFGLLYAQCEDDFSRVEMNYIEKLGRMAEVKGSKELAYDLYIRLIIDQEAAKKDYLRAPAWLKQLLQAYADGINYYLYKHPETKPALLAHFEPWYPLLWTDGSIGAISTGDVSEVETGLFYGVSKPGLSFIPKKYEDPDAKLTGSNGFAVGPSLSKSGNAMLYINPHVTFYFRPEVHVASEEGLHVYGAVTWGQFFVYQGFNEFGGWMHTSSEVDVADAYAETTREYKGKMQYLFEGKWHTMTEKQIQLRVKGEKKSMSVKAYFTHRGPVLAKRNGQWISVRSFNRSMTSLIQSWARTKTTSFADFKRVMEMRGNTSNNTVYAGQGGNIAYWHGNFVPKREPSKDWGQVQDGRYAKNDWQGLHSLDEIVHVYNPASGWIQNCNSTPYTVSGSSSPRRQDYPIYMAPDGENFRDRNAVRLFNQVGKLDIDGLIGLGYDRKLMAFETLIPSMVKKIEGLGNLTEEESKQLKGPLDTLRHWDFNANVNSIAQTLAVRWGQKIMPKVPKAIQSGGETDAVINLTQFAERGDAQIQAAALLDVLRELEEQWGTWQVKWGDMNRFQRISNQDPAVFKDDEPSLAVSFTSSAWGQLPSYTSKPLNGTKKWYGVNGNSFICAVEFGPKIKAKSLLAGGESGQIANPHFFDQAHMYAEGKFKQVLFDQSEVIKQANVKYHP
jgi:acyl-homoserine lactone acylase PvdQ